MRPPPAPFPFVASLVGIFVETGALATPEEEYGRRIPTKFATKIATKLGTKFATKFGLGGNGLPFVASLVVIFVDTGALATPACECRRMIPTKLATKIATKLGLGGIGLIFVASFVVIFVETGAFATPACECREDSDKARVKAGDKDRDKAFGGNPTKFGLGGNEFLFVG